MSKSRTPLQNALLYGTVTGLFGGSIWALIFVVFPIPDESLVAPRGIVIGGGVIFWFLVGFLVGVFNAPRSAGETVPQDRKGNSPVERIFTVVGWFLYRLLVGILVGVIATVAFCLVGFTPWFAAARLFLDMDKAVLDSPEGSALESSMMASLVSGFSGGVFGALLGSRRPRAGRPGVGSRAARGSFLAFLFGAPFGASLGWLPPTQTRIFVFLAASVPIGILAGILGGIWTEVRDREARDNVA